MSLFKSILSEQLLVELALKDHYEKFIQPKFPDISFKEYNDIAYLDPTTRNGNKGKYVEWLIKILPNDPYWRNHPEQNDEIIDLLDRFNKKPVDINTLKSLRELKQYVATLPEKSGKQEKKAGKEIFNKPDDIHIIDVTDEWIIAQPLTQEGNIILARWKSDESAKWCTADPSYSGHWNSYTRSGDLICFLNKTDGYEKYQIHVVNGEIEESRDFKDRISSRPYEIIKTSPNFEENYGKVKDLEPLVMTLDEEGTASYFLSEYFYDHERDYLNREPTEEEYEYGLDYKTIFQINHWERVIREGYDIFKNEHERNSAYSEIGDRMENFVSFFNNQDEDFDKTAAKDAVIDWYDDFESKFEEEYNVKDNTEDPYPHSNDFEDTYAYEDAVDEWKKRAVQDFMDEYSTEWTYIEFFLSEFPHEFSFNPEKDYDNSDEQLKLPFDESILKKLINTLTENEYADEIDSNLEIPETELEDVVAPEETEVPEEIEDTKEPLSTARVFSFDKVKINEELKELCQGVVLEFPHIQIKEILSKYELEIVKNDAEFDSEDGDFDFDLSTPDGKTISNSALACQWHKREDGDGYNFNAYLL